MLNKGVRKPLRALASGRVSRSVLKQSGTAVLRRAVDALPSLPASVARRSRTRRRRARESYLAELLARTRCVPIQAAIDVGVPVEIVYNQFTQFEDYPSFMLGLKSVEQVDETHVAFAFQWRKLTRRWEAVIVDQRPEERIAWHTAKGVELAGVATFHELADRLTRVNLSLVLEPHGVLERVGDRTGIARRALEANLRRFKTFIEMREQETGAWRGYVAEGSALDERRYFGIDAAGAGRNGNSASPKKRTARSQSRAKSKA